MSATEIPPLGYGIGINPRRQSVACPDTQDCELLIQTTGTEPDFTNERTGFKSSDQRFSRDEGLSLLGSKGRPT